MSKRFTYHLLSATIVMLLLLTSEVSYAQWTLDVVGSVKKEETKKRFEGVTITVKKNGSVWKTITSGSSGKFEASLDPNAVYLVEFSKPGHVTKRMEFSTKNVPPDDAKYGFEFPMEMNLFEKIDGLDVSILNKPIAKVAFDPSTGYMDYDPAYTKTVKAELERLKKELAERLKQLEAERKAKQAEYDKTIALADKAFNSEKWNEAKPLYEKAATIFPNETYPGDQLAEVAAKLAADAEKNKNYNAAIAAADKAFDAKDWDNATMNYQKASSLNSSEKYPVDRLNEIKALIAAEKKAEEEYNSAIAKADQLFGAKDYLKAKTEYQKASGLKPNETYPKDKITEIDKLTEESQRLEKEYAAAIKEGDDFFAAKDYEKSILSYTKASGLKPTESYPTNKIAEANDLLAKQKKLEEDYANLIKTADAALSSKDYQNAKTNYEEALTIKSDEQYPKDKLAEIKGILDEIAKKENEGKQREADYLAAITKGDKALGTKKYEEAKEAYSTALQLKSEEQYPKDKLSEIEGLLAEIAKKEEEEKAKNAQYDKLISEGDGLFASKDYEGAKSKFHSASEVKTEEQYPKNKIKEIDALLADIAKQKAEEEAALLAAQGKEQQYKTLIAQADDAFSSKNYDNAKTKYLEASNVKTEEQYPKDKIAEIDKILADIALKKEEDQLAAEAAKKKQEYYQALIAQADGELISKNYEEAKNKYTEASTILPDEKYPKTKIAEIDDILARIQLEKDNANLAEKEREEKYNSLITLADNNLSAEQYEEAKGNYSKALGIKSNEQYPKDKIEEINKILDDIARQEEEIRLTSNAQQQKLERYNSLIKNADASFAKKSYQEALDQYNSAASIMPTENYPKDQITEINRILAEIENNAKSEEEAKLAEKQKRADYNQLIYDADRLFRFDKYEEAKAKYEGALALYADEKYPKEQLAEIARKLAEVSEEEVVVVSNDGNGPRAKIDDSKEREIEKRIADMLKNRDSDKGIAVANDKKEFTSQEERRVSMLDEKIKATHNQLVMFDKEINAQNEDKDKYRIDNQEELDEFSKKLLEAEQDKIAEAESKRQDAKEEIIVTASEIDQFIDSQDAQLEDKVNELYTFADNVSESNLILRENAENRREDNIDVLDEMADKVRYDIEQGEKRRKEREIDLIKYKKELKEQNNKLLKFSRSKREFNRDSLVELITAIHQQQLDASKRYETNVEEIKKYEKTLTMLNKKRTKAADARREDNVKDVNRYQEVIDENNKKQTKKYYEKTAYLSDYKKGITKEQKLKDSKHSNSMQVAKTNIEKERKKNTESVKEKSKFHLRFYDEIEKERTYNQELTSDMQTIAHNKIREVRFDDVYRGEQHLSVNEELSGKYPQGITEETSEVGNAIVLRRIKVTGTHVNVYEKTFYKWGGTFYTKNGYNITQTLWDLESIEK